jgi:mRNA-degrading endonuclease YafQ of YafQ-DinJ toxin-antitoxin module
MRTIEYANAFKRDFRRTKAVPRYANTLDELLMAVLDRLVKDLPLPEANRDHVPGSNFMGPIA